MTTGLPYPGLIQAWLSFIRPKTWGVAIAPVVSALALVYAETRLLSPVVALLTLTLALLMQITTNMENDLGYTVRKAEKSNRKGLPRATANGWISMGTARVAIGVTICLALLNTLWLVVSGGWAFFFIGLVSVIAAYCYMGGPWPIAYSPFGELLVLIFFGLTAVCGTYYLQAHTVSLNAILLGIAIGATAASVLAVNNWRDKEHDASIQRHTLAVVTSSRTFTAVFLAMVVVPFVLLLWFCATLKTPWILLPLVLVPGLPKLLKDFQTKHGYELNSVMFGCVKLGLLYALLFTLGIILNIVLPISLP